MRWLPVIDGGTRSSTRRTAHESIFSQIQWIGEKSINNATITTTTATVMFAD